MPVRNYLKGGLLLSGGSILSAACSFARNIVIARLISVEDFGIAATFAMTMSLIEMASNMALDRLLVQAPDGDSPRMLSTAHAFQFFRGVLSAVALFFLAGPVAKLFDIPDAIWAFQLIALVPLIRSFMHLDVACQQREMRFAASAWLDTVPQVVTTLAAAPLAIWLRDYRVMVFIVIGQVVMMTLVSHLVAERPYRWAWDRAIIRRMLRFGWPLLINGVLMFAILQGDKAIIGTAFTMKELGWYAVAFSLPLVPSTVVLKVLYSFLMPLLAAAQVDDACFQQRSILCSQICMLLGTFIGVSFLFAGPGLLLLIYGDRYAAGVDVIGILGIMQGLRISKAGPAIVAMAKAETTNPLIANTVRCIGLVMALIFAIFGYSIVAIACCGLIGEFCGALTAVFLLRLRLGLNISALVRSFGITSFAMAGALMLVPRFFNASQPWTEVLIGGLLTFAVVGLVAALLPNSVKLVTQTIAEAMVKRNDKSGLTGMDAISE